MSTDDSEPITEGVDPRQGDLLELLETKSDDEGVSACETS
ncbi:hypothetical protein JOE54_001154 [Brachybacterium tyrofermentans]